MASIEIPFEVGEEVWVCKHASHRKQERCIECQGTKLVTVTWAGGETFQVKCEGCSRGFNDPCGFIEKTVVEWVPLTFIAESVTVDRGEVYYHAPHTRYSIEDMARTKEECQKKCDEKNKKYRDEQDERELRRLANNKEKNVSKVHYWRRQVTDLRKDLARAEARLRALKNE
jgi:hypothetical protein